MGKDRQENKKNKNKKPYFCLNCKRHHKRGKIYEDHYEKRAKVICKYCNNVVTKIRCPFCQTNNKESFIELMEVKKTIEEEERKKKELIDNKSKYYSPYIRNRAARHRRQKKTEKQLKIMFFIVLLLIPLSLLLWRPLGINTSGTNTPELEVTKIRVVNGGNNDISDDIEICVLIPIDESDEYNYTRSNFKEKIIDIASSVEIDLREYYGIWIQIDPLNKTIYKSNYHFAIGGQNKQYIDIIALLE